MKTKLIIFLCFFQIPLYSQINKNIQKEKDEILILTAYSYVYKDWQNPKLLSIEKRGFNIGAVLYDLEKDSIISFDRNNTKECNDKTQHAEIRLMQRCINEKCKGQKRSKYLNNTVLYTTLEPCMMCGGMMIFLKVPRVVHGQTDIEFGKNIERLKKRLVKKHRKKFIFGKKKIEVLRELNSREKNMTVEKSTSEFTKLLDEEYLKFIKFNKEKNIIDFLESDKAKSIYFNAYQQLLKYEIKYSENERILKQAKDLINSMQTNDDCFCK